jgi:hypothetical protein
MAKSVLNWLSSDNRPAGLQGSHVQGHALSLYLAASGVTAFASHLASGLLLRAVFRPHALGRSCPLGDWMYNIGFEACLRFLSIELRNDIH